MQENSTFGSKVKGKQNRGSMVFGKSSSITKNFESREFGRELTTNNSTALDNTTRNPQLMKHKTTVSNFLNKSELRSYKTTTNFPHLSTQMYMSISFFTVEAGSNKWSSEPEG